jgi:hypothetical protein
MKKYSIHNVQSEDGDFFHAVYEEQTQQVIDFFYFLDDAVDCATFMTNGGAFDGFTPNFMLREVVTATDTNNLNTEFSKEFSD